MDLISHDMDGLPWDFIGSRVRNHVTRQLLNDKPPVIIGRPMCTEYSAMSRINNSKMQTEEVEQRLAYARKRIEFCINVYEI